MVKEREPSQKGAVVDSKKKTTDKTHANIVASEDKTKPGDGESKFEAKASVEVIDERSKKKSKKKKFTKPKTPSIEITDEIPTHVEAITKNGITEDKKGDEITGLTDTESDRRTSLEVFDNVTNELKVASQSKSSGRSFLKALRNLRGSTDSETNTDTENESGQSPKCCFHKQITSANIVFFYTTFCNNIFKRHVFNQCNLPT